MLNQPKRLCLAVVSCALTWLGGDLMPAHGQQPVPAREPVPERFKSVRPGRAYLPEQEASHKALQHIYRFSLPQPKNEPQCQLMYDVFFRRIWEITWTDYQIVVDSRTGPLEGHGGLQRFDTSGPLCSCLRYSPVVVLLAVLPSLRPPFLCLFRQRAKITALNLGSFGDQNSRKFRSIIIEVSLKTVCVIGPLSQSKTMAKKSLYNAL